jgi:hypothetical protein
MPARTRLASFLLVACAALSGAAQASATSLQDDPDGLFLQPGEFTWMEGAQESGAGPVTMLVSLRDQRGYVYRDGQRIAVTTVSTGTPGHDTPIGVFPIMEKKPIHHSRIYDNAPMPWMQRLTMWGHALHAGHVRAGPASHGCIRLPAAFARQLFSLTRRGDLVVVSQDDSASALARAGLASRSAVMMAGAPVAPERIDEAMQALGQPGSVGIATEVGATAITAF